MVLILTIHLQSRSAELLAELARQRHTPVATYRLQFNAAFTFDQARELVPYLHALGISDCYASPYLKARQGSAHGYDVTDFQALNPEVGSASAYETYVETLQQYGMGQLLDMVPNHMGVLASDNAWWRDVLEHGPASAYAGFFDIDWQPPKAMLHNKVLLPVLGAAYGVVLDNQELCLTYAAGQFEVHYYEHRLPITPCSTAAIWRACVEELQLQLAEDDGQFLELQSIITALEHLPPYTERNPDKIAERYRETTVIRQRVTALYEASTALRKALAHVVQRFNGTRGVPRSFDRLHDLLEAQPYRLCSWRVASDEINYRRFFDINDLAAIRQEEPAVFEATHAFVLDLVVAGKITGLRIDHPDGLFDPLGYFQALQSAYVRRRCQRLCADGAPEAQADALAETLLARYVDEAQSRPRAPEARPLYVVVEKILEGPEQLPATWPVDGTTGYDFLNQLNGLFVDGSSAGAFRELYADFIGRHEEFADVLYAAKKLIMETSMASEVVYLGVELDRLSETHRTWRDFTRNRLTAALREVIACFPVYRTYIRSDAEGVSEADRAVITTAVARARHHNPAVVPAVFDYLSDILLLRYPPHNTAAERQAQLRFVRKFQQVTGPVMAKGLEDTAFYRYTPLASLNEVGGSPEHFGTSVQAFHRQNLVRQQRWPAAMSSTSTHDTKRSEDVRARLNVLSEIPQQWHDSLWHWHRLNQGHKAEVDGQLVPNRQEEYLLYQTLLGAYPLEDPTPDDGADFRSRVQAYMRKALREAKVHTSWINQNEAYEAAVDRFVEAVLDDTSSGQFLEAFRALFKTVAHFGLWNALAQTLLKLTVPGVPDVYQGCELWDFSLVDPDNRRPVDFARRQQYLAELQQRCREAPSRRLELAQELVQQRLDGRLKLYVIWQSLHWRRAHASLFFAGDYIPLEASGARHEHVFAFGRLHERQVAVVLVPRLLTRLLSGHLEVPCGAQIWGDTRIVIPERLSSPAYRHLFTGETITPVRQDGFTELNLADVSANFPVAVLHWPEV
jgi:(1->4)-alpha-D-glucan 1-alpha-D-glucosylmutase